LRQAATPVHEVAALSALKQDCKWSIGERKVVRVKDRFIFQSLTTIRQMVIRFWINWIAATKMEITKPSKVVQWGDLNKGIFEKAP